MTRRFLLVALALLGPGLAPATSASPVGGSARQPEWVVRDLGVRGDAIAINARGQVVGQREQRPNRPRAWLWESGRLTVLGTFGGPMALPSAINDSGEIVGTSAAPASSTYPVGTDHAFLWRRGAMIALAGLGERQSDATDINNRGQVVGWFQTSGGTHAFLWVKGTLTDLGTLGGTESSAVMINERGQVVGESTTKAGRRHAFLWQDGQMRDLGPPGAYQSQAVAINEQGRVIVQSFEQSFYEVVRGWLWQNGTFTNLGGLSKSHSAVPMTGVAALNDSGVVVGESETGSLRRHAFRWQSGKMTDLGTLASVRMASYGATGITNHGQIIGMLDAGAGKTRAWVWGSERLTALPGLGGSWNVPIDINERGQIVGGCMTKTGVHHVVIWTPRVRQHR